MMMTTERDMHRVTKRRHVEDHAAYATDAVTKLIHSDARSALVTVRILQCRKSAGSGTSNSMR